MADLQESQEDQQPSEQQPQEKSSRRRSTLVTVLVAVAVIVAIVLALWLLRGCIPNAGAPAATTTPKPVATAVVDNPALANRVHQAIHPIQLGNGTPADNHVYIIDVTSKGATSTATIQLTDTAADAQKQLGSAVLADTVNRFMVATLAKVPQITIVKVVDWNGVPMGSQSRR